MSGVPTKGGTRPPKGGKGSGKGKAARAPLAGGTNVTSAGTAGSATGKGSLHHSDGTRTRGSKRTHGSNRTGGNASNKKKAKKERQLDADGNEKKKRRINRAKKEPWRRWARYIHKLQRGEKDREKENMSMSLRSMKIVGAFCDDMFEKIVASASQIAKMNHTKTVTAKEIQTACRLMLPEDFAQHSISEGTRAVTRYNQAKEAQQQE